MYSMTGYGKAVETFNDKTVTTEIRSLNSKFVDVKLKIPQNYKEKELEIRKIILQHAERGKIDVLIDIKSIIGDDSYAVNKQVFKKYHAQLKELSTELEISSNDLFQSILRLPNVVEPAEAEVDENEWSAVKQTLIAALEKLNTFRGDEGGSIESDFRLRVGSIKNLLDDLDPFEKKRIEIIKQRLRTNLDQHLGSENIDENRFEQEVIFYLEKIDITEEKVRLEQHCKYFISELDKEVSQKGRKLNFITQEIGREINTMGAKANSSDIQKIVILMKDELEKIKEQVANIV